MIPIQAYHGPSTNSVPSKFDEQRLYVLVIYH